MTQWGYSLPTSSDRRTPSPVKWSRAFQEEEQHREMGWLWTCFCLLSAFFSLAFPCYPHGHISCRRCFSVAIFAERAVTLSVFAVSFVCLICSLSRYNTKVMRRRGACRIQTVFVLKSSPRSNSDRGEKGAWDSHWHPWAEAGGAIPGGARWGWVKFR